MAAGGLRWYVQVTILWAVKTERCSLFILFWKDITVLHLSQGEKHHACWAFARSMSVRMPNDVLLNVFGSTAVDKAPEVHKETSGWKYIFRNGYCVSCAHNQIGWRVYWTTVIFNNPPENYAVARNLCWLLWKGFFYKMESKAYYSYEKITPLFNFGSITHSELAHDKFDVW